MKEHYYEKLLNIKTKATIQLQESMHYHPYEPTPYSALETLFNYYQLNREDHLVDFGCGKGRLPFFVHYQYDVTVKGIEINDTFFLDAIENQKRYQKKTKRNTERIEFLYCLAEEYRINPSDNRFYFFNPFSIQIFRKVIQNIMLSVEQSKREVELILYYCSDEYMYYLENKTMFELKEEIRLPELYEQNEYERFLIYRLVY